MGDVVARGAGGGGSGMHVLSRHREILHDYNQEFHKTKVLGLVHFESALGRSERVLSVQTMVDTHREHAELLSSVRDDLRSSSQLHQCTRVCACLCRAEPKTAPQCTLALFTISAARTKLTWQRMTSAPTRCCASATRCRPPTVWLTKSSSMPRCFVWTHRAGLCAAFPFDHVPPVLPAACLHCLAQPDGLVAHEHAIVRKMA